MEGQCEDYGSGMVGEEVDYIFPTAYGLQMSPADIAATVINKINIKMGIQTLRLIKPYQELGKT